MGLPTIIEKIKRRRELTRVSKESIARAGTGTRLVPTTRGFIEVRRGVGGRGVVVTRRPRAEAEAERQGLSLQKIKELADIGKQKIAELKSQLETKIRTRVLKGRGEIVEAKQNLKSSISNIRSNISTQKTNIQTLSLESLKKFTAKPTTEIREVAKKEIREPFLEERTTKFIEGTPVRDIFFVDPRTGEERKATTTEVKTFRKQIKITPSEVQPGETKKQQLSRLIIESTPQLEFLGKSKEANTIRKIIGTGFGTEKFARDKVEKLFINLKDKEGKNIFTTIQAKKTSDLLSTIGENLIAGLGVGKVVGVGRGAVVKAFPKFVKEPVVEKARKVVGTVALAGIGTAEAVGVSKTLKEEGSDAAILRLVGLASFGIGFAKAGLKPSAEAVKDAEKFSSNLKRLVPPGKRGQAALIRKKKGRFAELEKLFAPNKKELEKIKAVRGSIEKRLLQTKDPQKQLKILAEIAKKLKTPRARENFQLFVKDLINKRILKQFTFEVAAPPKLKARLPPIKVPSIKKAVVIEVEPKIKISKVRQRELERIKKTKIKQEQRVKQVQKSLGERFKEAQKQISAGRFKTIQKVSAALVVTSKIVSAQKTLQKQKERLRTLQLQKVAPRLISGQKLLIRTTQTSITQLIERQRGISRIPRIGRRVPPTKIVPIKLPIPFGFTKTKGIGVRKIEAPSKRKGYNVLIKQKGKFFKANKVPLTRNRARDLATFVTDKSLSARWKIKKAGKSAKKPIIIIPRNYAARTSNKFRPFKKIKGVRKPIANSGIERRKFRLDTGSEVKKIQASKFIKQLSKRLPKIKPLIKLKKKK